MNKIIILLINLFFISTNIYASENTTSDEVNYEINNKSIFSDYCSEIISGSNLKVDHYFRIGFDSKSWSIRVKSIDGCWVKSSSGMAFNALNIAVIEPL